MPLFSSTPHENHIALDRLRAVSSFSFRASLNRPNGLNRSNRYSITATMCTESKTSSHKLIWKGRRNESRLFLLDSFWGWDVIQELNVCILLVLVTHWFNKQKYRNTNLIYQFRLVAGQRLTDYLTNKLKKRMIAHFNGITGCLAVLGLTEGMMDWRTDWLNDWQTNRLVDWQTDGQTDWRSHRQTDRLTDWWADGLTE